MYWFIRLNQVAPGPAAGDARFFPMMQRSQGDAGQGSGPADAPFAGQPVYAAVKRA